MSNSIGNKMIAISLLMLAALRAQSNKIDLTNWGAITAPVFGTAEKGVYSSAELFAGPNKFGSYYSGVLPNGRIVKPAGTSIQIGMNPLGAALTPDGHYLITSNDDEREGKITSYQSSMNIGGYSLSVIDTKTMTVVSQTGAVGKFFIGLQATGSGPYTVWASGGADQDVKIFTVSATGTIAAATPAHIVISPITPATSGYATNYTPGAALNTADANGNKPPLPSGFGSRTAATKITFPAGSALSPDGKWLYVACNGDNSVAVIDTTAMTVVKQVPVGYFPYGVSVSPSGAKVLVANWGIEEYKFFAPGYDAAGNLNSVGVAPNNLPDGFYVPPTDTQGTNPKTSSVTVLIAPAGNGAALTTSQAVYEGLPLDALNQVGDTHPSATAIVKHGSLEVLYVAKTNVDALGMVVVNNNRKLPDFDLTPLTFAQSQHSRLDGAYPNAMAVSPDNNRLYVTEAGLNSVAVIDVSNAAQPKLLGRLGTGWYPTAIVVSPDGDTLYVANAKGVGEDINPNTNTGTGTAPPTGLASDSRVDSNYIFGSLQKINLTSTSYDGTTVIGQNFAFNPPADTSVVPVGGAASSKIKHVVFILKENKTFDSMLGNLGSHFGPFASMSFNDQTGAAYTNGQYTGVSVNLQTLASKFAAAVNYYSDSEESDAGHQFAASGTASDYTEKTLLVKGGRGLLVAKNFEPEDYPAGGYIFNNAARNRVSFKDYGALIRIVGTDTGGSVPSTIDDPTSGLLGYPLLQAGKFSVTNPLQNGGDVDSETQGLGQTYALKLPILAVLGQNNPNGEPHLDEYYPGYNFNISDQRRAEEFNADFDTMVDLGTLPQFLYVYLPNDHTGGVTAPNAATVGSSPLQQIADGDVALGMVVNHIMNSPVYYDAASDTGTAIFVTWDDAQSSLDHIHPHRTPMVAIGPYVKPGYIAAKHYSTASIVKTEELLLGLPPNNLGDLFATDLRDMFQPTYNGITAADVPVTRAKVFVSYEGRQIWKLVKKLDTSAPDRDSSRLGALTRLSVEADNLHRSAVKQRKLGTAGYRKRQAALYEQALKVANSDKPKDDDDR